MRQIEITYSVALVSARTIKRSGRVLAGVESRPVEESERTLVYHWRCLLMSQKEATVAMIVKKPVITQPTSCATGIGVQSINQSINSVLTDMFRQPQTLKYDLAVLKERRPPFGCLWRKASHIRTRHDRLLSV